MTKTEALRIAQKAHSQPYQHGGWKFTAPRSIMPLSGQVSEVSCRDYWHARQERAGAVAAAALHLMGWDWYDAHRAVEWAQPGNARDLVNGLLRAKGEAA